MRNKNFFLCLSLLFLFLSIGVAWYGNMSVGKQAAMITMRSRFEGAEKVLKAGRRKEAAAAYRVVSVDYKKEIVKPGYYIGLGGDFLTAGNCFWQQGQFRSALGAYRQGLKQDPNSITLLTSAGFCALRLGDTALAAGFLQQSKKFYPGNRKVNKALRKLKARRQTKDLK
ncbi:MAG: tetratricopeptide repeat protein [Deltaproteobacteria bacterium]|nr:tetratricopeptide repeat protein [Candidatus Tharpella aukensis]